MPSRLETPRRHGRAIWYDLIAAAILAVLVFAVYVRTLAPGMLDGDQGEYQYMPLIGGILHPPGFPLYLLLGNLVSHLPIGGMAFRMNLLSAVTAACCIGLLYVTLRRRALHWLGAAAGVLSIAFIPAFWRSATTAAVDALNILFVILLVLFLGEWERFLQRRWLWAALLSFGLGLASHPTLVLLGPATALLIILVARATLWRDIRTYLVATFFMAAPVVLLYGGLYIRGTLLTSQRDLIPQFPVEVAQGLVSPYFKPELASFAQYLTGSSFVHSVGWDWSRFVADSLAQIDQTLGIPLFLLAFVGIAYGLTRSHRVIAFVVVGFLTVWVVAVRYNQGLVDINQEVTGIHRYLLVGLTLLTVSIALGVEFLIVNLPQRIRDTRLQRIAYVFATIVVAAALAISLKGISRYDPSPVIAHSAELEAKWDGIQRFAPEAHAALIGHWGDVNSLWYLQYSEGWRPDLYGIFPPTMELVDAWSDTGKPLYLAGSLLGWASGIEARYQMLPWGDLVRIAPRGFVPSLTLAQTADANFELGDTRVRLLSYELPAAGWRVGDVVDIPVFWEVATDVQASDVIAYLSLTHPGRASSDTSFPLFVNFLPGSTLGAGQRGLALYHYRIPWGTASGDFDLRLKLYSLSGSSALAVKERDSLSLGMVHITRAQNYPDRVASEHASDASFGGHIALLGWEGQVETITPGDPLSLGLLWKRLSNAPGLTAVWSLRQGEKSRQLAQNAILPREIVWHTGEILREETELVFPADLSDGEYALVLVVRSNDKPLSLDANLFSRQAEYSLTRLRVVNRSHSFELPTISSPLEVDFGDALTLLGYAAHVKSGTIELSLYWRAKQLMGKSFTSFVHVLNGNGKIVAQQDSIPGHATMPTSGWLPGEVVDESYNFALPPGRYRIEIGWYDPSTGVRLEARGQDYILVDEGFDIP